MGTKLHLLMSSVGNPGNVASGKYVSAPDKGIFPLDRAHQCSSAMAAYLKCLKENKHESKACRDVGAAYLKCRMANGLMDQEEMDALGFKEE